MIRDQMSHIVTIIENVNNIKKAILGQNDRFPI